MSLKVATVSFPDQEAIVKYIASHPLKQTIDAKPFTAKAPDSIEKIAKCFANKTMSPDAIAENIKITLRNTEKEQELADLKKSLQKYFVSCEEIDAKSERKNSVWFTTSMKEIHSNLHERDDLFEIVIVIYDTVLHDLLDNATFTPPAKGEKNWKRHVNDLTRNDK